MFASQSHSTRRAWQRVTSEHVLETPDYEPISFVGSGACADVWMVRHRATGELRCWKQLRPDWEHNPTARALFENEAHVGKTVSSPHVTRVLEARTDRTPRYLILTWHPGQTLEGLLINQPRLPLHRALSLSRQCAQGLADLHAAGFTHGDIKPANIQVGRNDVAVLLDLGFSQQLSVDRMRKSPRGPLTGTLEYLAPESLQRGPANGAVKDLYSLGVTLYRLLTGSLPFEGETPAEILCQQREAKPYPLRRQAPHVPSEVARLVEQLLAKQPLRRPASARELLDLLIPLEIAEFAAFLQEITDDRLSGCDRPLSPKP